MASSYLLKWRHLYRLLRLKFDHNCTRCGCCNNCSQTCVQIKAVENFKLLNSLTWALVAPLIINKSNYQHFVCSPWHFRSPNGVGWLKGFSSLQCRKSEEYSSNLLLCFGTFIWLIAKLRLYQMPFHSRHLLSACRFFVVFSIHFGSQSISILFSTILVMRPSCFCSNHGVFQSMQTITHRHFHIEFQFKKRTFHVLSYSQHTNQCISASCRHGHKIFHVI